MCAFALPGASETDDAISIIGAVNALFATGAAFGAIAQGWVGDWLGRKRALAAAMTCALVGAALSTASTAIAMLITVRILHGFGLGMIICLVPLYITEVVSAHSKVPGQKLVMLDKPCHVQED